MYFQELDHVSQSDDSSVSNVKHNCKGCFKEFTRLMTHLEMRPDCMIMYSQKELDNYKRQNQKKRHKKCYNIKKKMKADKEVIM